MKPMSGVLVVVVWLAMAAAQSTGSGATPSIPGPATQRAQTWTDPDLHLSFTYPAELKPMDAATLPGADRNSVFGNDPDAEPGNLLFGRCSKVLLSVGKAADSRQPGGWGSILFAEIDAACIPPKALRSRKAMDDLLKPLVTSGTQILGMVPVSVAATYPVAGHRFHIAESEGQPVAKGDLQPAESQQLIAILAVQVDDHILSWKIESNDVNLFGRMLGSSVDFGMGGPQPIYPLQMPGKTIQ